MLISFLVGLVVGGVATWRLVHKDCPRRYLGYHCACDHSKEAWKEAKK